jgi:hypothetical protein
MPGKTAKEIARSAGLKVPATDCLAEAQNARHYVELLMEKHLWMDAIAYLSHAITPRESIWWAWFCARKASLPKEDPEELKALALAEAWIGQPTEANRVAAKEGAERLPASSPPQSVLQAVYFTGELIDEATGEKTMGAPLVAHKYVHAAVLNSVYGIAPKDPEPVAMEFLRQGLEVAHRIQLWTQYS